MPSPRTRPIQPPREGTAFIRVRKDGGLRIAVIADTHSHPHPRSVEIVAQQRPDAILHAGDIGDLAVLDSFGKVAPLSSVRGNVDTKGCGLPDRLEVVLTKNAGGEAPQAALLKILLVHIGVYGPKLCADVARMAIQKRTQLVVCGHSHVPFIGRDRGLSVFNPGSIGPHRFSLPVVFGMLELNDGKLDLWHVDCETGRRWLPEGTPWTLSSRPSFVQVELDKVHRSR